MTHFRAIPVLALLVLSTSIAQAGGAAKAKEKDKDFSFTGKLTADDPKDEQRMGPKQVHLVRMKAGKVYTLDQVSTEFDSYMRILDPTGKVLEEDDDSGGDLNSRIIFTCPKDGEYKIVCTTFAAAAGGNYTLTVKTAGSIQIPSTAHALMVGKDAPEFQADFAVNGKAIHLADLEGKVVLLYFMDIRSASSVAGLAKLKEWNKIHQAKGLTIVGVTFYTSDIDQQLSFDKKTGAVVTAKAANHKSDQALLREFAEYHKVDHLLLALSKQQALDTFNAYAVNGYPQLVLIDRKGAVRQVDVSGGKNSTLESDITKLLNEK